MTLRRTLVLLAASFSILVAGCCSNGATGSGDSDIPSRTTRSSRRVSRYTRRTARHVTAQTSAAPTRGPHLSIVYEPNHYGDGAFLLAALRGVPQHHWCYGDMPPVPGLSEEDIDAIVAFVREQQRRHGFEPYPP